MEGATGSEKPWDHAWSTEEMRKNRRDWSLAGDSGLLKHLQQFSDNLTKKASETQEAIDSITSQLNETAILVDNITNTSLALANTQFIESRVQEDNIEIEQPVENAAKNEDNHEFSATDLLVDVCESIKRGLSIIDEKFERVEVIASDSEDEDDNPLPSVILRPKDPYQDRPLPYIIGSEQWKNSSKVGLESSSSESEQNDEDEDSVSDTDDKNVGNILNTNPRTNLGIGRLSSTSSESNDYNIESSSIKDNDHSRLHARSQDTLNSDTEPTTPSSILPKSQSTSNGPPTFAEELAKRLGNVVPSQKNKVAQNANEQVIHTSKDENFSPEDDQDVFSNKTDNLFSEGKNLFSDEVSSSSWKNKPVRPVNSTIIPPSIDVPPPLSIISSAPKTTIDDLFGDADDSEDSDDIFSKKTSKDIFAEERETIRSEVVSKQRNPNVENVINTSTMTTSTPQMNKGKGLFEDEDEDDDDLFKSASMQPKSSEPSTSQPARKKPVGGVSIFGKVDLLSTSKFPRRPSTSSSASTDSTDQQRVGSSASEAAAPPRLNVVAAPSTSSDSSGSQNVISPVLIAGHPAAMFAGNSTNNSSGIFVQNPIDNTVGSSVGSDFQPQLTSTRLKSEEIYRERVASDSLFTSGSSGIGEVIQQQPRQQQQQQQQRQQQQQQQQHQQQQQQQQQQPRQQPAQPPQDDAFEQDDVFGPPPLPKPSDASRSKSKVASLFDDSDSGDDLFASASPGSRSLRSTGTPSKSTQPTPKGRSLFDDEDELFGTGDAPDVDLFGAAPTRSIAKPAAGGGLFDDVDDGGLFARPKSPAEKPKPSTSSKPSTSAEKPRSKGLFDDSPDSDLFAKPAAKGASLFGDSSESDLFAGSANSILDRNVLETSSTHSLFGSGTTPEASKAKKVSSIFGGSDDDEQDLFGGSSLARKPAKAATSIFEADKKDEEKMEAEKKVESEQPLAEKKEEKALVAPPKVMEKASLFDDDDDDDDLFGEKKKKKAETSKKEEGRKKEEAPKKKEETPKKEAAVKQEEAPKKEEAVKKEEAPEKEETTTKEEAPKKEEAVKKEKTQRKEEGSPKKEAEARPARPEVAPKTAAVLAEIKQKLEKHRVEQPVKSEVDGAVSSKKEPPKTLKIKTGLPIPSDDAAPSQPAAKPKPAVSDKIKKLSGRIGDMKILSPTDTPPLFRKAAKEKTANGDDQEADSGNSEASTPSLPSGGSSPQTSGHSKNRDSSSIKSDNTEVAVSFDEPIQVEILASTASKSRARIQTKRRPQSRQARHSALLQSGIDFDMTDGSDGQGDADHLQPSRNQADGSRHNADSGHAEDKSEISASRNTTTNLLSPSTDEEDLFDVPPDLPEDPATKEESLFGRAPILSPIDPIEKPVRKQESSKPDSSAAKVKGNDEEKGVNPEKEEQKTKKPLDPLRDDSHDPLKDPTQLFAFVTKTPSPEKNKSLIVSEDDDSLFSSSSKPVETKSKPTLGLFDDDDDASNSDLFSSSKAKIKKPLKDTKIDLFNEGATEDDDDDSLFGSSTKKSDKTNKSEKPTAPASLPVAKEVKADSKSAKTATKDIFDNSSDEDDLFASTKKAIPKKKTKSLFDDDEDGADDDDDIFGKPKSSVPRESKAAEDNGRPVVKKAVTRDLKKTAEKIVEDPLSMLQGD